MRHSIWFLVLPFSTFVQAHPTIKHPVISYLERLSADEMEGRLPGTKGHEKAKDMLTNWMHLRGLKPAGEKNSYQQSVRQKQKILGQNLLGIIPNHNPNDKPVILLSAHYDHHGTHCASSPLAHSKYCNGAADNAAGVAAVMGVVEQLVGKTSVPIAVAFWDLEEQGLVGSNYFAKHPSFSTNQLQLMINLDIVGLTLVPQLKGIHLAIGAESGGEALTKDVQLAAQYAQQKLFNFSYALGAHRSDMTSFVANGYKLPFVFFSDGDGSVYHTTGDEFAYVDYAKVLRISHMVTELTKLAMKRATPYSYQLETGFMGITLPKFTDAKTMHALCEMVLTDPKLPQARRNRLTKISKSLSSLSQPGTPAMILVSTLLRAKSELLTEL
jgi:hypothetical protein